MIPNCPTDCTPSSPQTNAVDCITDVAFGEIKRLYFSAQPLPNWRTFIDQYLIDNVGSTPAEAFEAFKVTFRALVSNSGTNPDAIRELLIRGEKPAPESTRLRIAGGNYVTPPKKHNISYSIDDTGDVNYEALRQFECNDLHYVMYEDESYLYGGEAEGSSIFTTINWDHIIPLSHEELQSFTGLLEWEAKFSPSRIEKVS
jgi:hypothetical protein